MAVYVSATSQTYNKLFSVSPINQKVLENRLASASHTAFCQRVCQIQRLVLRKDTLQGA